MGADNRKPRRETGDADPPRPPAAPEAEPIVRVARRAAAYGAAAIEPAPENGDSNGEASLVLGHATRLATIGIFLVLLGGVLKSASPVVIPVVAAIVIGSVIGPVAEWAARRRIPPLLTSIALVIAVSATIYLTVITLVAPVASWIDRGPEIAQILREKLHALRGPLRQIQNLYETLQGELAGAEAPPLKVKPETGGLLPGIVVVATPALTQILLFVGTLLFFLASRAGLRRRLVIVFGSRAARLLALRIMNDIDRNLTTYVGTVSIINVAIGLLTAGAMFLIGMPNPEMWGLLAFILNFVPYLGPATMTGLLFIAGVVTMPTLVGALVPPVIYLAIHGVEGNFVTPGIVGRRLTLNPFLLFLSLAFWTWMWGPVGAFLAMPLMIVAMVVVQHLFPGDEIDLPG